MKEGKSNGGNKKNLMAEKIGACVCDTPHLAPHISGVTICLKCKGVC